jgi:hypothetical protein
MTPSSSPAILELWLERWNESGGKPLKGNHKSKIAGVSAGVSGSG